MRGGGGYASASSTCLRGVEKENFTFLAVLKSIPRQLFHVFFTDSVPSTLVYLRELHVFNVSSMLYVSKVSRISSGTE
jgi:hypothetical protein